MHSALPSWQKNSLRLLAWGFLFAVLWTCNQTPVFADGGTPGVVATEERDFWTQLLGTIFNSRGIMELLAKPEYTVLAFIAVNLIVFVETGLLIGFFLPGDSLLVITGLICANPVCGWNLPLLLLTLCLSAIVGDSVGYIIGFKAGPKIFNRENSFFFHKDHLLKAQQFYENHGGKTIIIARFMPILRTFAPVVAGVGKMAYRQFLFFNIFGGISWVCSMVLIGRFLPNAMNPMLSSMFDREVHVENHVEIVVILVVLLSISPGLFAWVKSKLGSKEKLPTTASQPEPVLSGNIAK